MVRTKHEFTCDRCGAVEVFSSESNFDFRRVIFDKEVAVRDHQQVNVDLCSTCNESLNRWYKAGKNDE